MPPLHARHMPRHLATPSPHRLATATCTPHATSTTSHTTQTTCLWALVQPPMQLHHQCSMYLGARLTSHTTLTTSFDCTPQHSTCMGAGSASHTAPTTVCLTFNVHRFSFVVRPPMQPTTPSTRRLFVAYNLAQGWVPPPHYHSRLLLEIYLFFIPILPIRPV
jgi:hypothetical protein